MTIEIWDPDQALPVDDSALEETEGCADTRYGVTAWEARHCVPLDIALAEELPDVTAEPASDDPWMFVDDEAPIHGQLMSDDFDGACVVEDSTGASAEELAMHVVET